MSSADEFFVKDAQTRQPAPKELGRGRSPEAKKVVVQLQVRVGREQATAKTRNKNVTFSAAFGKTLQEGKSEREREKYFGEVGVS